MCKIENICSLFKGKVWLVFVLLFTFGGWGSSIEFEVDQLAFPVLSGKTVRHKCGDLNNDGFSDLVVIEMGSPRTIAWYENKGTDSFEEHPISEILISNTSLFEIIDYNNDGWLDIVYTYTSIKNGYNLKHVGLLLNKKNEEFTDTSFIISRYYHSGLDNPFHSSTYTKIVDIDGDDDYDFLNANYLKISANSGAGIIGGKVRFVISENYNNVFKMAYVESIKTGNIPVELGAYTFNIDGDTKKDFLFHYKRHDNYDLYWAEEDNSDSFTIVDTLKQKDYSSFISPPDTTFTDINIDGKDDILIVHNDSLFLKVNPGDNTFNDSVFLTLTNSMKYDIIDFNGDYDKDVLFEDGRVIKNLFDMGLRSPASDEEIISTQKYEIKWHYTSHFTANIMLEYSVNNGADWTTIIASTPNDSTFEWDVPAILSSNCKIRLSNPSTGKILDETIGTFSIVNGTLAVTSPNGAESFIGGTTKEIIWEGNGNIGTVKLEYTSDGVLWNNIASGETNDGTYTWAIPDISSTNCKVRVSSELNPEITDESDAAFTITPTPKISLTAPNGTESWIVGTSQNITWTAENLQGGVDISYSVDSGTTWKTIVTNTPSDGTHPWIIPNEIGSKVMVKVSESGDNIPSDMSDAAFSIALPTITMVSPNGGEIWFKGTTHALTWTSVGTVGQVKLEYTTGIGWNPITLSTDNDGSYSWTVPNTESATCKIRISDVSNSSIRDASDSDFIITTTPSLTVTAPNGSEAWTEGSTENITWTKAGSVGKVKIEYTVDGTSWKVVADSAENNGTFAWAVPRDPSTTVKVRVTDISNSAVTDVSDANFTLRVAPKIDITAPIGAEQWEVGSTQSISWLTEGVVGNVHIEYSADSGATWKLVTASTSSSSAYSWKIPNDVSTSVFVRVMQTGSLTPADTSTAVLEIYGTSITVISPNGGELLTVGDLSTIGWTTRGTVGPVKLEYTTDGTTWTDIITSTENNGSYNWTVPDYVTTSAKVRVSEVARPTIFDESDALFTIDGGTVRIITDPTSAAVTKGSAVQFSVSAMGLAPITYQWQKNGTPIFAATAATYEIASAIESDAAEYRCIATNAGGSDTSSVATLTVSSTIPTFTTATPQTIAEDTPLTLTLAMTDATDADGDPLTFIVGSGVNYTFDGAVITPTHNYHGLITVPLQVTDGVTPTPVVNMTITVTPVNDAPNVKAPIADMVITINEEFVFSCLPETLFNDVDGDIPALSFTGLPLGITYDGINLVGVPTVHGINTVTVRGTDDAGLFSEFTFVMTVDALGSIIEEESDSEVKRAKQLLVTPNPASQDLERVMIHLPIDASGEATILVLDVQGNILDEQHITITSKKRYFWDLRNKYEVKVASGAYYVMLEVEGRRYKTLLGVKE